MNGSDGGREGARGQLQRVFAGPSWVGPSTEEVLARATPEQALASPILGSNRIIDLVLHMAWWKDAARRAIGGEPLPPAGDDFPDPDPGGARQAWGAAQDALARAHHTLLEAISAMTDEDVHRTVPGREYAFDVLFHGLAQHEAYHLGQIRLMLAARG